MADSKRIRCSCGSRIEIIESDDQFLLCCTKPECNKIFTDGTGPLVGQDSPSGQLEDDGVAAAAKTVCGDSIPSAPDFFPVESTTKSVPDLPTEQLEADDVGEMVSLRKSVSSDTSVEDEASNTSRAYFRSMSSFIEDTGNCPDCGSRLIAANPDIGEGVFICYECNTCFGFDDAMEPADWSRLYEEKKIGAQVPTGCSCGNSDANEFIYQGIDETGKPKLECMRCGSFVYLEMSEEKSDGYNDLDEWEYVEDRIENLSGSYLPCGNCSNAENDLFEKTFCDNGLLTSVQCLVCDHVVPMFESPTLCHICGNSDRKQFENQFDDSSKSWLVTCTVCKNFSVHHPDSSSQTPSFFPTTNLRQNPQKPVRKRVTSLSELQAGDHVSWRRPAYWHHAIVVDVQPMAKKLAIIHYSGGLKKVDGHYASVRQEILSVRDLRKHEMFKNIYNVEFAPRDVISRAQSRLGEHRYNPFSRNCEHFVSWCKMGVGMCDQVKAFAGKVAKGGGSAISKLTEEGIAAASGVAADGSPVRDVCRVGFKAAAKRVSGGGRTAASIKGGAVACNLVLNLAAEAAIFGYCAYAARKQYKNGEISRTDYKKELCRVGGECGGGFLAGTGGGFLGQLLIPVPFLGGFVGSVLGNIIGRYLGGLVGQKLGAHVCKEK